MSNLCIIPARGGSKRIPSKNIKLFLDKPIISYSIKAALDSGIFDEVMVSTDDLEIAEIAREFGANVPFMRSDETANDHATTFAVLEEVIDNYTEQGRTFENTCCLYATAPFVTAERLNSAFDLMNDRGFKTVFPIMDFSFPIQRSLQVEDNRVSYVQPENRYKRSQDLPKRYHDVGQFYFMKTEVVTNKEELVSDNTGVIIINEMEAQDIDTEVDWALAELKYKISIMNI